MQGTISGFGYQSSGSGTIGGRYIVAHPGMGISGMIKGKRALVGSSLFIEPEGAF